MSQTGVYGENKMVWWYAREGQLPDAPKQVQVILSDLCNQDCSFCAYRMSGYTSNQLFMAGAEASKYGHNNPKRFIPTERAISLMEEIKDLGVLAVQFTGGGEPTVHPDHEAIFVKARSLGLRCSLVSNGVRWSATLPQILREFDWVRVSIDAAKKSSYISTRRTGGKQWDEAWSNVRRLAEVIHGAKTDCVLGLGFVVTPSSYPEIVEFARLAYEAGVNNVRYTAMFSTEDEKPFLHIYDTVKELIAQARRYERDKFKVYDNFGSRFDDLRQHRPDYTTCPYQYYTSYIGGDLGAYRCCVLAYNQRGKIATGDLSTQRFDDFWRRPERKVDLANLDPRGCERCQFNQKNMGLLSVMNESLPHKEWP